MASPFAPLLLLLGIAQALRFEGSNASTGAEVTSLDKHRAGMTTLQGLKDRIEAQVRELQAHDQLRASASLNSTANEPPEANDCRGECPLWSLRQPTRILPGGRTSCLFGDEFGFQVHPGASDKLYIHLNGGGACWSEWTCTGLRTCISSSEYTQFYPGLFDFCNRDGPFAGYTAIIVPDCSGDLYAADVDRPWRNPNSAFKPVQQHGHANVRAVLDWVKKNMSPRLQHLSIVGNSAGSIGTMLWARTILNEFPHERASVLGDSYIGVLPTGFQQSLFADFGVCDSNLLPPNLKARCPDITIQDVLHQSMTDFPGVQFGVQTSKNDIVQIGFHNVAAMVGTLMDVTPSCNGAGDCPIELSRTKGLMSPEEFHGVVERIIEGYNVHPNFVSYMMSGMGHSLITRTFGSCPDLDYSHCESGIFMGSEQRNSMRDWAIQFFAPTISKRSHCERYYPEQPDDYCRPEQEGKVSFLLFR